MKRPVEQKNETEGEDVKRSRDRRQRKEEHEKPLVTRVLGHMLPLWQCLRQPFGALFLNWRPSVLPKRSAGRAAAIVAAALRTRHGGTKKFPPRLTQHHNSPEHHQLCDQRSNFRSTSYSLDVSHACTAATLYVLLVSNPGLPYRTQTARGDGEKMTRPVVGSNRARDKDLFSENRSSLLWGA